MKNAGWLAMLLGLQAGAALPRAAAAHDTPRDTTAMTRQASGTFTVKMVPATAENVAPDAAMGRMLLDKQYSGALEASGQGQMLTAMGTVPTSAAYVAVERVSGSLHGRRGSFLLVHKGVMTTMAQTLQIDIVPDSGTGELQGIAGTLGIRIEGSVHYYDLGYTLP